MASDTGSKITNYARLGHAAQHELPNLLRELLVIKEPPHLLDGHVHVNSFLSRNLRSHELAVIQGVRSNSYNNFDVPLMYKIIRNLNLVPPPTRGWESQIDPMSSEITIGDDIERIRRKRNEIVHRGNTNVPNSELSNYFSLFKDIAGRFEVHLKRRSQEFVSRVANIETCNMDERITKMYLDRLSELEKRDRCLKDDVSSLRTVVEDMEHKVKSVKESEETIPKNIKYQHEQYIREWTMDEETFVKTRASEYVLNTIMKRNCITVTGSSGTGKSSIIHHIALQLHTDLGYEVIPFLTGPADVIHYYNRNRKQVFVIDDICGKINVNIETVNSWNDFMDKIERIVLDHINEESATIINNVKVLISCRLQIYNDPQFQRLKLFTRQTCDLLSPDLCLLPNERIKILNAYLSDETMTDHIKHLVGEFDYFPLLCKMSSGKTKSELIQLFSKPMQTFKNDMFQLQSSNNMSHFCAIAICVLLKNNFKEEWLNPKYAPVHVNNALRNIFKECKLDFETQTSRNLVKNAFDTLKGTYFRKIGNAYVMIHDKIYDTAAVMCGEYLFECFLKHAPSTFIGDRYRFVSVNKTNAADTFIKVTRNMEQEYFERLLEDLTQKDIYSVLHNKQLANDVFRKKLLKYLRTQTRKVATCICKTDITSENDNSPILTTPLIEATCEGFPDIVKFILELGCDIDKTDSMGRTALHAACRGGYLNVVQILLDNGANVNLSNPINIACTYGHICIAKLLMDNNANIHESLDVNGRSPLMLASKGGHISVVSMLLERGADVDKRDIFGHYPLLMASAGGYANVVELLLTNNPTVIISDAKGASPLYTACLGGHIEVVKILLKNTATSLHRADCSPLFIACMEGHVPVVQLLLNNNADINECDEYGISPISAACEGGYEQIVQMLLDNKADVHHCDIWGESILWKACKRGHLDIVKSLLQRHVDIEKCNFSRDSPFSTACRSGHSDIVRLFLKIKTDIFQTDRHKMSIPYDVCYRGYLNVLKTLSDSGADIFHTKVNGKSLLYVACERGHTPIVQYLLEHNVDINECDNSNKTPLHVACERGFADIVAQLLYKNADLTLEDENGQTPFHMVCRSGNLDTVKLLIIDKNVDIRKCDNFGNYPLMTACIAGHINITKLLLDKMVDISKCNKSGRFPIHAACEVGHIGLIKLLLDQKADVSTFDIFGRTPLHTACSAGHLSVVELLIDIGVDTNHCDSHGRSPLYIASEKGYLDIVKCLVDNDTNINLCDKDGMSALHVACNEPHAEVVRLLLDHNADVNESDRHGRSPLYIACTGSGAHLSLLKILLNNNANVSHTNNIGETILFLTCERGYVSAVDLLLKFNAEVNTCNRLGESPLNVAFIRKNFQTAVLLLKNNADISLCDFNGRYLLHSACHGKSEQLIQLLLENNVDVNFKDIRGYTPLHIVCANQWENESVVALLLKHNASVTAQDDFGKTPLHYAIKNLNAISLVKRLLQSNANIHIRDEDGNTPFRLALHMFHQKNDMLIYVIFQHIKKSVRDDRLLLELDNDYVISHTKNEFQGMVLLFLGCETEKEDLVGKIHEKYFFKFKWYKQFLSDVAYKERNSYIFQKMTDIQGMDLDSTLTRLFVKFLILNRHYINETIKKLGRFKYGHKFPNVTLPVGELMDIHDF